MTLSLQSAGSYHAERQRLLIKAANLTLQVVRWRKFVRPIMREWLLIFLFVGGPLVIPLSILWLFTRGYAKSARSAVEFHHINIAGARLLITKKDLFTFGMWLIVIYWLDSFVPFFFLPAAITLGLLILVRTRNSTTVEVGEHSRHVLDSLQEMQAQISDARSHIERLASEVQVRQVELEAQERLKTSLKEEIEGRLKEVEAWKALTDEQKNLFIKATKEAVTNRTTIQMISVVLGSIAVNLAASIIWALMGSPGKDQLIDAFNNFKAFFNQAP